MRHNSILMGRPAPRAIASRVRAEVDATTLIGQIGAAVTEMKTDLTGRLVAVESAFNTQAAQIAGHRLNGGGGGFRSDDPEYSKLFASYFRNGSDESAVRDAQRLGNRSQIQAAMSVGSNTDGGYLAPTEWDRRINAALVTVSPMRRLATVQTTTVNAYSTLWNNKGWGSGWVGEVAARPATTTATLSPITFGHGEIYANAAATQRLLDDADMDVEAWLTSELTIEFDRQEGISFISGSGTNQPFGLLQFVTGGTAATQHPGGVLSVTTAAGTTAVTSDELTSLVYGLLAPYRQNASWLMSSATASVIMKMKDGQGNYLWRESFAAGQPATLMGRPVEFDENMPPMATGNLAIAFGDFKAGYLINDRLGTRILRDPYTNKPFVMVYATRRVGGGVKDPSAVRLLKLA